jgi:phage terminase large subunit
MDRRGWCVFIGTPKGKNEFWKIIDNSRKDPDWFDLTLKASESGILTKEDLKIAQTLQTEDQYAQEFECSFEAAVLGTYYASLIDRAEQMGRMQNLPYDPDFPVHAVADLGYTDSCSWWFWQQRPDGLAIIDFEEDNSKPLQFYLDMLDDKPYEYGTIWLPHDAKAKTLQTGRSTVEQVIDHYEHTDTEIALVPSLSIQHGIDAARLVLPSCYFDLVNCTLGIEALRAYRRKYDEINNCFSNKPLHDWSSHGSDAWRYLSIVAKEFLPSTEPGTQPRRKYQPLKPVDIKLAPMFEEREKRMNTSRRIRRI